MSSGYVISNWKSPVATSSNLPSTGNALGDARVAQDLGFVFVWNGSSWINNGGSGTVTSVALSAPPFLSVSGSPITGAGTLALSLATESANTVFAGPASGAAAAPTFRTLTTTDMAAIQNSKTISTDYTITDTDEAIFFDADAAIANITVTLPLAVSVPGKIYSLTKINSGSYSAYFSVSGSDVIIGNLSPTQYGYGDGLTIQSDGVDKWVQIAFTQAPIYIGAVVTNGTHSGILYVDNSGTLASSANLVFDGTALSTATAVDLTMTAFTDGTNGQNIYITAPDGATTDGFVRIAGGNDAGNGYVQIYGPRLGFFGQTPTNIATTSITAATFSANTSGIVDDSATWDGYTTGQIVAALRAYGLLA